jgi:hypothetical protein
VTGEHNDVWFASLEKRWVVYTRYLQVRARASLVCRVFLQKRVVFYDTERGKRLGVEPYNPHYEKWLN